MDVNKDIGIAAAFAQAVWIAAGIVLYLTTPGAALLSSSAAVFFVAGMFVVAPLIGLAFHGVRRGIACAPAAAADVPTPPMFRMSSVSTWLLPVAEVIVIFVAAGWAFDQVETFRAGVPVEYARERDSFDGSLKSFSAANNLEEQAKPGREQGQVDADIEAKVVAFMEDGIARSRNVGEPFLTYLHPELPERYRTQLVKGYELLVEGRRTGDVAMQTTGNELVRQFYEDFLPTRADTIIEKLGLRAQ
jgi:hypothetical protein